MGRLLAASSLVFLAVSSLRAEPAEERAAAFARSAALREKGSYEEALEALRPLVEADPSDAGALREMGLTCYRQAQEILSGTSPALGALALVDARRWLERAAAAAPDDPAAFGLLGEVALAGSEFAAAEEAWRRVTELAPEDGEAWYQLGFALGYQRRFGEAIEAFRPARVHLGPDPRVLLNWGICHVGLEEREAAREKLLELLVVECEAGRPGSEQGLGGWTWLWRVHSGPGAYGLAAEDFGALAERFPGVAAAWWYLAHARQEQGELPAAEEAYGRVVAISPGYAAAWQKLGEVRLGQGSYRGVEEALDRLLVLGAEGEGARDLLISLARALTDADRLADGLAVLERKREGFPTDPRVLQVRGDLEFRSGQALRAIRTYRQAHENDPFGDEIPVKEQKAVTALLRRGDVPEDLQPVRVEEPDEPGRGSDVIFDFEDPQVYVRPYGAVRGRREEGGYRVTRTGEPGAPAGLYLMLVPTLDTRPFKWIEFTIQGAVGTYLDLQAKDCYDEFAVHGLNTRLVLVVPVALEGNRKTFSFPLAGIKPEEERPLEMVRSRLRMLLFELGRQSHEMWPLADDVIIDDVALVTGDGERLVLADFDEEPEEAVFLTEGAATAFLPMIRTSEQAAAYRPDPNTFVNPVILGEEYDPAMVHGGEGAFRMVLPREGAASGVLGLSPARDLGRAGAITFRARGAAGGEKLRVALVDALDGDLANQTPASCPRILDGGRLREGWFVLSEDWQEYRLPRSTLPDVDFRSLIELRFHFGTDEGNPVGTTIYLDDLAWK